MVKRNRRNFEVNLSTKSLMPIWLILFMFTLPQQSSGQAQELPNILWLVSEDNSPLIGAYGDEFATTPNIDKLASEGFLYEKAYANAPVCAPARNTIITGIYSTSGGNQHMRSNYGASEAITFFPQFLREAGYYTTNNAKEDYNITTEQTREIWNESSGRAHYKNRKPGQPFFSVFNINESHESSLHSRIPLDELRHDPDKVTIPPYHPDTPDIRHDWAQYYDHIENMDAWIGEKLQELEESGEADNTIVFYYGDHGGVLPRSKRFVYETGTRVPLIVRIPEKYKHLWPAEEPGNPIDRLISFVDLAPTLLSLIDTPIPEFMQGNAFLGEQKTPDPEYAFMFRGRMDERYDMSRAVRGPKYRYIRNYMPYRIYGQHLGYLWRAPSTQSWEKTCKSGGCNDVQNIFWNTKPVEELYDTENDPWEVNNLAEDPEYLPVVERMRKANQDWMVKIKDSGFIPEAELADRSGNMPIYDFMRSDKVSLGKIIQAAETATLATESDIPELKALLNSDDSAIRYWGATGLLILGKQASPATVELIAALTDSSPNVVVVASEALYNLGEIKSAHSGFKHVLETSGHFARNHVLNAIDSVDDESSEMQDAVIAMIKDAGELTRQHYDHRAARSLIDKWGIDPAQYGIEASW
ncbi:MAG: sulfatase-like hydrolase/transferase [Balneolales bacterium]